MRSLRERIAQQYSAPFDVIFDSPQAAAELRHVDRAVAFALLIGPLAFGRISTLADFDYEKVAVAAVDGFLRRSPRTRRHRYRTEYRIGRCLRPPTNVVAESSGAPANSMDSSRGISSVNRLFISILASAAPRQKCTP